jgi:hypothetical protein
MLIANPIYDAVFKYLMDDLPVAKVIISTIIGQEIEELQFKQRERSAQVAALGVSVFRLDFSAVVKTADGQRRNVLIEIQKADSGSDIPRFRRYLAENYYTPASRSSQRMGDDDPDAPDALDDQERASTLDQSHAPLLPIITIYILGYSLKHLRGRSGVLIRRTYHDLITGEEFPCREDFIELLTHDSYVIQLSELKQRRRTKLERLLALFEQMHLQANAHLKEFQDDLPEEFQVVLDRLYQAALDKRLREEMALEDEVLELWKRTERCHAQALDEARKREEEARKQADEERRLREEAGKREEEARQREDEARRHAEEERRLKEEALAELARLRGQAR